MQALFPSKTLLFTYLQHCKSFRKSVPEVSYNEGKCEFVSSPCIQIKTTDSKMSRQSGDLNLGIPDLRWTTSPCTYSVWKPWEHRKSNPKPGIWQSSRRLLLQWHLARPSAPKSLWNTPFWLFIKSIFSSFCIPSTGQLQIPFFHLI